MELTSNRVWDYVGDNFVHRLVQTDSADGKLVEAEGGGGGQGGGGGGHYYSSQAMDGGQCKGGGGGGGVVDGVMVNTDEKLDSIQLEYTCLLYTSPSPRDS